MERVKGNSNFEEKGVRGLATIVKLNKDNLRVDFEDEKSGHFPVKVTEDSIPEYFPFKKMQEGKSVKVSATMNKDGDKLLFATPASGEFEAKFEKFPCPEGLQPAPESFPGKKGKAYKAFGALIEVVSGIWTGAKYYYRMYPNFGADEAGNLAVAGSGSGSDALYDFLEATGVSQHEIPFSENPLPEIQTIAQEEARTFKIIVQKGWIDMIVKPLSAEEDAFAGEDLPDVDDVHPALKED